MTTMKPIIFNLDGQKYGIDIALVNAIEQIQKVVTVPNAPDYIKGIINLRGDIVPVYSLREKFGLPENPSGDSKLIITNINLMQVAIEVDEVSEITDIEQVDISAAPPIVMATETAYIDSIAKVEDSMVIIISTQRLMSGEEAADVRAFMENQ